jgi:hypothetical protein
VRPTEPVGYNEDGAEGNDVRDRAAAQRNMLREGARSTRARPMRVRRGWRRSSRWKGDTDEVGRLGDAGVVGKWRRRGGEVAAPVRLVTWGRARVRRAIYAAVRRGGVKSETQGLISFWGYSSSDPV